MSMQIQHKGETLRVRTSSYTASCGVAVLLDCDEGPYGVLSINIQDALVDGDEFVLNHDFNSDPALVDTMVAKGLIEKTDKTVSYGWVQDQPIYRVTPALLGEEVMEKAAKVGKRKAESRKCTFCGKGGKGVTLAPDPYQADVNHDDTRVWMHDECRAIVAQDI